MLSRAEELKDAEATARAATAATTWITGTLILTHLASIAFFLYALYNVYAEGQETTFKLPRSRDEEQGGIELQSAGSRAQRQGTDVGFAQPSSAKPLPIPPGKRSTSTVRLVENPMK